MKTEYIEFLRSKIPQAEVCGFQPPTEVHAGLFPHQGDVATWACKGGRRAVFASFGLGKTRIHLQLSQWVTDHTGGLFLIIAPLGVRQEFTKSDGPALGMQIPLNTELSARNIEKHVCPLQLDIIERCIRRYSNEGEIILDPFMGVGSTAVQALKMKRKALGCELNADYWKVSAAFCERQEADLEMPTLFDIWQE